jgi:hypothetical protein
MIAMVFVASLCMVIAQPLSSSQRSALIDVYNGLGWFRLPTPPQSCVKSVFFFSRMQHNHVSSIPFDRGLHSTGKMQWWQCREFVRSMLVGKRNVILTDVDLHRSQEHHQPAINWNYFIVNWSVDGAYKFVRPPFVVLIAGSLTSLALQKPVQQSIERNADFIYWPIDNAQFVVRCRFE